MHRNLNKPPHDEKNLKPLPITIESCQKEHLFIPKIRPTRSVLHKPQRFHSCRTEVIQYQNNTKINQKTP